MGVILYLLLSLPATAEYRAFELSVVNEEKGTSRTVITTLDHIQYQTYYPLTAGETVHYVNSWMCWENMSQFRRPCPPPVPTEVGTEQR